MNGNLTPPTLPFLSTEEVALLKRTQLSKFAEDEQETFIRICQRTKLDPFTRQIYATRRYQTVRDENGERKKVPTLVAVTGIMGLCALAERTHDYDGCEISWSSKNGEWKGEWLADEVPEAAKCIVYHKHRKFPEVGIARWGSYAGQAWNNQTKAWEITEFWSKMPDYMLAKCAKAQALRGAFPDQLSNVYIREELESNITEAEHETVTIPADEQKIADNRKKEEAIKASGKFQVVEEIPPSQPKPTPEQMAEPIEPHKIPPKPEIAPQPRPPQPTMTTPPAAEPRADAPLGPEPAISGASDLMESFTGSQPGIATSQEAGDGQQPPPWRDHVILGVTHAKFHKRKIGDLNQAELQVIENQWLPAIREQWDDATDAQRADARAFESAIAYHKMQKPW
jgi:phage recombination protein Bet